MLEKRQVVVMEGYTDVIMAHQQGIANAVAVLGTALTREHIQLLRRYAEEVVLVFDGDAAGQRSAAEGTEPRFLRSSSAPPHRVSSSPGSAGTPA